MQPLKPIWSSFRYNVDDRLQPFLNTVVQELIQIIEIVRAWLSLDPRPNSPKFHRIQSRGRNELEVSFPFGRSGKRWPVILRAENDRPVVHLSDGPLKLASFQSLYPLTAPPTVALAKYF